MKRITTLFTAFMLIGILCFGQNNSPLQERISLQINNLTIKEVLFQIEELTGVSFTYSSQEINVDRKYSLKADNQTLASILKKLFPEEGINFIVRGKRILINRETPEILQNLRGTVYDGANNLPVPGANVIIVGSDPIIGVPTDINGRFMIADLPIGRYDLRISFMGYIPVDLSQIQLDAGKEKVINVSMQESVTNLESVVVTAEIDKSRPLNEMALVSAKSFTVEETSRYAGSFNDPARMATTFAGVISAQDDTDNGIIIRGNSPRGLLWRLEGLEIFNPNHFAQDGASSGAISILNSNILTDSDFLTGAFPAEYGNAFSGVFDLKLRNGNNEKREYSFQAGFLGLQASLEGPIKPKKERNVANASYLVSYRYSTISLLEELGLNIAGDGVAVPAYQDLAFKFNLPTEKAGVFSLYGLGGTSKTQEDYLKRENGINYNLSEDEQYRMGAMGVNHIINISKNAFLESAASYNVNHYDFFLENVNNAQIYDEDIEDYMNTSYRVSSSLQQKFSARHSSKLGIIYSNQGYKINSEGRFSDGTPRYQANEKGSFSMLQAYFSHKANLTNQLSLTGGLHYIRLDLAGQDNIEPRFGLQWQFRPNQSFSLGFGIHSRREESSLYFTELIDNGQYSQPNKNLDLGKAAHYVLAYDRNFNTGFHLKLEAYYQDLYNVPVSINRSFLYSSLNQSNSYQRVALENAGGGYNYGLEFTFEKFFTTNYFFLLTGSIYNSKFNLPGTRFFNTQYNGNYSANVVAGKEYVFGSGAKQKTLNIGFESVFGGGARRTPIDLEASRAAGETVLEQGNPFSIRLKDFFRLDFQVSLKTNKKGITHELKLDIQNVTSRAHVIGQRYSSSEDRIVNASFTGEMIPVLSYRITF